MAIEAGRLPLATQPQPPPIEPLPETDLNPDTAPPTPMSTGKKIGNLAGIVLPMLGLPVAAVLLWQWLVDWADLANMAGFYLAVGLGVTVGYHRLFTHRSFETSRPVRFLFAVLGSMALEGPVISWVGNHRKHHSFTDEHGDPHSPWVGRGTGLRERLHGFLYAHAGWLFQEHGVTAERYAADLNNDPDMRWLSRPKVYIAIIALDLALPTLIGWMVHGGVMGAVRGLIWGGLVRMFFLFQATLSINSLCHIFGRQRFNIGNRATNLGWLVFPTLGEAWHNNHHAFPTSAVHGMGRWDFDLSAGVIWLMEKTHIAWNVKRFTPQQQREKQERLAAEALEREQAQAQSASAEPQAA